MAQRQALEKTPRRPAWNRLSPDLLLGLLAQNLWVRRLATSVQRGLRLLSDHASTLELRGNRPRTREDRYQHMDFAMRRYLSPHPVLRPEARHTPRSL